MRVTSSSVFSPVRTRYVTETQSGAWPASAATVRSRTSTSLSSRGAMNSNEMLERSQHRTPARAHAIAQLADGDRAAGGDDLFDHHHRRRVGLFGEGDVIADAHHVAAFDEGTDELIARPGFLHRLRERGRRERLTSQQRHELPCRAGAGLEHNAVVGRGKRTVALDDAAVVDQALDHRRK